VYKPFTVLIDAHKTGISEFKKPLAQKTSGLRDENLFH